MSIRIVTDAEQRETRKFPAMRYIPVPMRGVIEESLRPEQLAALKTWRNKFYAWSRSPEALAQCARIQQIQKQLAEAKTALQDLNEKATRETRNAFTALIRTKESSDV